VLPRKALKTAQQRIKEFGVEAEFSRLVMP
jgi:hypothetical protein